MKNIITLAFSLFVLLPLSGKIFAQEKARTKIAHVKQKDETILFTLSSSRPFIFGNNRYILHIGNNDFFRNKQSKNNGKGIMTFMIPATDFNALQEGTAIYLTYGQPTTDNSELEELSKNSDTPCWSLGKFSKTLLTK